MTTTCAAKHLERLKEIKPRIVIMEEAAEVLEPHLVLTLMKFDDMKGLWPLYSLQTLALFRVMIPPRGGILCVRSLGRNNADF